MKTKNILKIGVFSVIILSLLISPILKSITPETNAFTNFLGGLFGTGTSATGLNLEDYLSTCTSSAANNTITNNPTAYTVLCCNEEDLNYSGVINSTSHSALDANCKTAEENASGQAIPGFVEDWCFAPQWVSSDYPIGSPLSNTENALNYIERCCKVGDQATSINAAVAQKQIDKFCQNAEDTLSTYLQTEVAAETGTIIKDCVSPYDESNPTFMDLYQHLDKYLDECCQFTPAEKDASLTSDEKALLDYRCKKVKEDNYLPMTTEDTGPSLTPPPPNYNYPGGGVQQWVDYETKIAEESGEKICAGIGTENAKWYDFGTQGWTEHLSCVIQKSIIEGLGKMFAAMINWQVGMILWAFDPATYGGFVKNPAVQGTTDNLGAWNFIRDLVNLVLILALVFIAITTILGIKKYSWQQTLWKLIVVALLVNFSLVIAGMILDVSNFFAYTFLNLAKMNNENIAKSMILSFDTEKLSGKEKYEIVPLPPVTQATTTGWGMSWGNFLIAAFALILIGLFAFIALLAIFISMIVRSFILIALLCVTPVAFAAWIFPDTEKYWKMWWDQFIKWCTFPIIFGLMLYIGIYAVNNLGISGSEAKLGMIPFIVRIFLFSMFLVGGLIFSIQGGGAVAQTVTKQAGKLGLAAGAFVGYKALKGATGSETWRKAQKRLEDSKKAPLHDLGVWMGRQPEKIRTAELKQIEGDYKKRSEDQIRADMKLHPTDRRRVALGINTIAERGEGKLNYEKDSEFIRIARNQPDLNVPAIKKAHPELYAEYFTKPEDMDKEIEQAQLAAPGISPSEAKKRAIINLTSKRVRESSTEAIKSGNWGNILDRLENIGKEEGKDTKYSDLFFNSLLDKNVPPEGFAAMLRSMDTEKQANWAQKFKESVGRKIKDNREEAIIGELEKRRFYQNRFWRELLPEEKPVEEKKGGGKEEKPEEPKEWRELFKK